MIEIVIAEDHRIVREGLKYLLEAHGSFKVTGEAANGIEAVSETERVTPHILLLDLSLPKLHGLEVLSQLGRRRLPKVVILSMHGDPPSVQEALQLGARGFVLKDSPSAELVSGLLTIHSGGLFVSPALSPLIIKAAMRMETRHAMGGATLSRREREVLRLVASGLSSEVVAERLAISLGTVAKHRGNVMRKTSAKTVSELVIYAVRHRLIEI